MKNELSRRTFLKGTVAASIAATFQGLRPRLASSQTIVSPYGPPMPTADEMTGLNFINLPKGFTYKTTGLTGDLLMDGTPTPGGHDGMAVVASEGAVVYMVRNHEIYDTGMAFGTDPAIVYDPASLGGCSTLAFDTATGDWLPDRANISISGTSANCAGGPTPWGTWLTCEETLASVDDLGQDDTTGITYAQDHGWIFEVPGLPGTKSTAQPLTAMGRFVHEATAVDPATGYIYETQDRTPSGLYRFIPNVAGNLAQSGTLEMLAVEGIPNADLIGQASAIANGTVFPVEWVPIADPTRAHTDAATRDGGGTFDQGAVLGGAAFARLEGAWYSVIDKLIYVISTSGGVASEGQLWCYDDVAKTITMVYESPDPLMLNNPDNVVITPKGAVLFCEDGGSVRDPFGNIRRHESLMGLANGEIFSFAENNIVLTADLSHTILAGDYRTKEWAGATFDPTGQWLFVNIQTPGVTFAITGPWENGPL